jgi:oligosaccharide repeat unit polymerase
MIKVQSEAASLATLSTATLLSGLIITSFLLPTSDSPGDMFTFAAIGLGLSLSIATGIEAFAGPRNLIRVDIVAFWVLYALTFLEFLFPQQNIDFLVLSGAATSGTYAVFIAFAGLAIGRHLVPRRETRAISADIRSADIFFVFVLATVVGYFYIFFTVDFNPIEVLRQMSLPRFDQSWSRGRYGDASALLYELGALAYLIPPIAGLICARSQEYTYIQKLIVTIVLLFTFYSGFASGTRSVFGCYVITFFGAYFLTKPQIKIRQILVQGLPIVAISLLAMSYMLDFRKQGIGDLSVAPPSTLYVDHNLIVISRLTELFPDQHTYLGLEIPYFGLVHPIPRVLWPDKPENLSFSIEEAFGADPASVTIAATFVGEMFMSGGFLAILVAAVILGALTELWNRLGRNLHARFDLLLYMSGFVCAAMTMRSLIWMSVTALPTLALWVYGKLSLSSSIPAKPSQKGS